MSRLEVGSLCAHYGRRQVLHEVSLPPLAAGEVVALLGPNGSGKSSLLKAVAGLLPATGVLRLDGQDLTHWSRAQRVARVAYLPQALPAPVHVNVTEAMLAALRALDGARSGDLARCAKVLARLGIDGLADAWLDQLSGGQRQLVGLAQALVREPGVLLLDEPLSALDLRHQWRTMQLLARLAREDGLAILVVLHDLNTALHHCSGAVLLHEGRVAAAGSPAEVVTPAALARVYGVQARVEPCSQGRLQVLVDAEGPP
jgi:iron complex transport system ATP-binding protein